MDSLKIVAVVRMNDSYAVVLNRALSFEAYSSTGKIVYSEDSGFFSRFRYEGGSRAFAGRHFNLQMDDGSILECKGDWWDGGTGELEFLISKSLKSVPVGTIEGLTNCYVFSSGLVDEAVLNGLLGKYYGPVYEYWDYEAVIKFKPMRLSSFRKTAKLERDKKHLIRKVKETSRSLNALETAGEEK